MSVSITTAIPVGPIQDFCIYSLFLDLDQEDRPQCANSTRGTTPADYETICCDGMIIDTTQNLYGYHPYRNNSRLVTALDNLVCCGLSSDVQAGGIGPIPDTSNTVCNDGQPTPLASLAATNTGNAQPFLVTYTSASFGTATTGDFIPTQTPYCLWANTVSGTESLQIITVPAAQISTLPSASTDEVGDPIPTSTTFPTTTSFSSSQTATSTIGTATGTGSAGKMRAGQRGTVTALLGCLTLLAAVS